MFTGIILDIGKIASLQAQGEDMRLHIQTNTLALDMLSIGDSVAVNGVCLTVTALPGDGFSADVSTETLRCTTLGRLAEGDRVNLETALTPTTALGGHLVSGHVDGVGVIINRQTEARSECYTIEVPAALAKYIASKGSVCIDGVSLTVNTVNANQFTVNIIPHTQEKTLFGAYAVNTNVNIEVDVVARYLERLLAARV